MKKINIAIDGFSGTGKSSTAKEVAIRLRYKYLDSGAMYRSITWYALDRKLNVSNENEVVDCLADFHLEFLVDGSVQVNGSDVTKEIRSMTVSNSVSIVSAYQKIRQFMVARQQAMGKTKGIVMDGRDIGTVVFPNAELKIFMTANVKVRAERRQKELLEKGEKTELSVITTNLEERDRIDSSRPVSPLVKAEDAIEIDTSYLTFAQQVDKIVDLAEGRIQ